MQRLIAVAPSALLVLVVVVISYSETTSLAFSPLLIENNNNVYERFRNRVTKRRPRVTSNFFLSANSNNNKNPALLHAYIIPGPDETITNNNEYTTTTSGSSISTLLFQDDDYTVNGTPSKVSSGFVEFLNKESAALARLAVAYSPKDRPINIRNIHQVRVVYVGDNHMDIEVIIGNEGWEQCVSLLVSATYPKSCSDKDSSSDIELCVIENLGVMNTYAAQVVEESINNEETDQLQTTAQHEDREDYVLLIQELQSDDNIQYPEWWEFPNLNMALAKGCDSVRGLMNMEEFQYDMQQLVSRTLQSALVEVIENTKDTTSSVSDNLHTENQAQDVKDFALESLEKEMDTSYILDSIVKTEQTARLLLQARIRMEAKVKAIDRSINKEKNARALLQARLGMKKDDMGKRNVLSSVECHPAKKAEQTARSLLQARISIENKARARGKSISAEKNARALLKARLVMKKNGVDKQQDNVSSVEFDLTRKAEQTARSLLQTRIKMEDKAKTMERNKNVEKNARALLQARLRLKKKGVDEQRNVVSFVEFDLTKKAEKTARSLLQTRIRMEVETKEKEKSILPEKLGTTKNGADKQQNVATSVELVLAKKAEQTSRSLLQCRISMEFKAKAMDKIISAEKNARALLQERIGMKKNGADTQQNVCSSLELDLGKKSEQIARSLLQSRVRMENRARAKNVSEPKTNSDTVIREADETAATESREVQLNSRDEVIVLEKSNDSIVGVDNNKDFAMNKNESIAQQQEGSKWPIAAALVVNRVAVAALGPAGMIIKASIISSGHEASAQKNEIVVIPFQFNRRVSDEDSLRDAVLSIVDGGEFD